MDALRVVSRLRDAAPHAAAVSMMGVVDALCFLFRWKCSQWSGAHPSHRRIHIHTGRPPLSQNENGPLPKVKFMLDRINKFEFCTEKTDI